MRSDDVSYSTLPTPDSDPGNRLEISAATPSTTSSYDFVFDPADGDIELQASGKWSLNNTLFKTRKYLLNKFEVLAKLVRDTESAVQPPASGSVPLPRVAIKCDAQLIGDFNNTNKILYASVIEGPFDFDTPTLVSALRVATVYRYDGLRQFSISKLEKAKLSAIQRIKIAQELDVTHWTQPAFQELANRTEAIQPDEARILGIDALLLVSNMREERRARRGNGASTIVSETDTALAGCRAQESPRADLTRDGQSDVDGDTIYHLPDVDDDLLGEGSKTCFIGALFPPLRVYIPNKSRRQRLEVNFPDCTCTDPEVGDCVACRIPPCLFKTLRSMQVQQMIHSDEIIALQGTMSALGG